MAQSRSLTIPVIAAIFAAPFFLFAGPLWLQDWRARSQWTQANDLRFEAMACYGHRMVVLACMMTYSQREASGPMARSSHTLNYVVTAVDPPHRVNFLRQKEQAGAITTDFGIDQLGNRSSLMAVFATVLVLGIGTVIVRIMRS